MATVTLNATEVRKDLLNLLRKAHDSLQRVIVTRKGRPEVVLLPFEEYEGWLETFEISSDPEWVKALEEAKIERAKGRFVSFKEVFGRLQRGLKK
jgi:prevent-host-death family protein